jgi:hypothetical protein
LFNNFSSYWDDDAKRNRGLITQNYVNLLLLSTTPKEYEELVGIEDHTAEMSLPATKSFDFEDDGLHLPASFDYLPPTLKLLCWPKFPMRCMPYDFCPENLVKLEMRESKLYKLWEGVVVSFENNFLCYYFGFWMTTVPRDV